MTLVERIGIGAGVLIFAVAIGALFYFNQPRETPMVVAMKSVALQAMERGYQCRAEGRTLQSCQAAQQMRWTAGK